MKLAPAWWLQFPKRQTILVLCLLLLLHALQHGPCEFLCSPDLLICSLQWSLSADRVDRTWVSSMLFLRLPSFLVHHDGPWSRFFFMFCLHACALTSISSSRRWREMSVYVCPCACALISISSSWRHRIFYLFTFCMFLIRPSWYLSDATVLGLKFLATCTSTFVKQENGRDFV